MAITSNVTPAPAPMKQTLASAYLDFTTGSGLDWSQQYVPDLMEREAEIFGPRTISGFLSQVGAEESKTADQVVWSEQSRLHLSYTVTTATTGTTFTVTNDADGTAATSFVTAAASDTITLNGTTTGGGAIGDYVEVIDIASNQYAVNGMVTCAAGSNPATMFSATVS